MPKIPKIKIFADGANSDAMKELFQKGFVTGFTTNPTLMKQSGVSDYAKFARELLDEIKTLPISFEVLSDDFPAMEKEARQVASWGSNVYVKIPITNTCGESSLPLIRKLSHDGLHINVTAILALDQVRGAVEALPDKIPNIISVFAGRIADTGRDPVPVMKESVALAKAKPGIEILWASPRELLNLFQAAEAGCHIITMANDLLKKIPMIGKDLSQRSLETVQMFFNDAKAAGLSL
ncbi:transaldolase [bacterium CG2_30_54_10]|nr:MAG: transaldolase [bacterium CG2_30_54_10]